MSRCFVLAAPGSKVQTAEEVPAEGKKGFSCIHFILL